MYVRAIENVSRVTDSVSFRITEENYGAFPSDSDAQTSGLGLVAAAARRVKFHRHLRLQQLSRTKLTSKQEPNRGFASSYLRRYICPCHLSCSDSGS